MEKDDAPPDPKRKPPPPSLSKAPPPSPPPPDPPREQERESGQAVKVSVAKGSTADDPDPAASSSSGDAVPGADAGMPNRVIAAFLDGVIASGMCLGVMFVLPSFLDFLGALPGIAYGLTRDSLPFLQGQSIGKKAMGIQAVTMSGESLAGNWQAGIIRNVSMVIPFVVFVELFVLINRQHEPKPLLRLGDEWGKTKVINAAPRPVESGDGGGEVG